MPPRGTGLRRHPDRAALGWAGAAAVGIALYNVTDARGVRIAPDPLTFIGVFVVIAAAALLGYFLPARRATRIVVGPQLTVSDTARRTPTASPHLRDD